MSKIKNQILSNIVIIFQGSESVTAEAFNNCGLPVSVTADPSQADMLTSQMDFPLVVVELTNENTNKIEATLSKLLNSVNLPLFPILIISQDQIKAELKFDLSQLFKEINFLTISEDRTKFLKELNARMLSYIGQSSSSLKLIEATSSDSNSNVSRFENYFNHNSRFLNGDVYIQTLNPKSLLECDYLPEDEKYLKIIENVELESSKWEWNHFNRTSFVSHSILKSLNLSETIDESIKAAPMLLFFPNGLNSESITKSGYIRKSQESVRKNICNVLRANAESYKLQEHLTELAPIVSRVANLFDLDWKENSISDPPDLIASTILIAELIDRECWQDYIWNQKAAYQVLLWLCNSSQQRLDQRVVLESMRFLAEAFEVNVSTKTTLNTPKAEREELLVPISKIKPGMILARPIFTQDNRELLKAGVNLDSDLIIRLWKLASICPIYPNTYIKDF